MDSEFKAGQVVQLKSGGPNMTVSSVGERWGEPKIYCTWFQGPKKLEEAFNPVELKIISE